MDKKPEVKLTEFSSSGCVVRNLALGVVRNPLLPSPVSDSLIFTLGFTVSYSAGKLIME